MLETLREACLQLFSSGWLEPLDDVEYGKQTSESLTDFPNSPVCTLDARRLLELRRIREIFIPEMVLRLHRSLMVSRQWIPELVPFIEITPQWG